MYGGTNPGCVCEVWSSGDFYSSGPIGGSAISRFVVTLTVHLALNRCNAPADQPPELCIVGSRDSVPMHIECIAASAN